MANRASKILFLSKYLPLWPPFFTFVQTKIVINMKFSILTIILSICFNVLSFAQEATNRAEDLQAQAQKNIEQKEYTKARYLFMQAYHAFAAQANYKEATACATQVSMLYHRENYYKEAFDICRAAEALVLAGEQQQKKNFYDLRFTIAKERLNLYTKLKNGVQAKIQLNHMEEMARQAGSGLLREELLYAEAGYYYTFGQHAEGDASFRKLIAEYKVKKEYDKISECYQNLIAIARNANNAALVDRTYGQLILWTDSVKALTAQDELNVLKRKYDDSQQMVQEKEDSLTAKQYLIMGLCALVVILLVVLAFLGILLLRLSATVRKQKKRICIANEHNELKTQFIHNISMQMEPSLATLTASANRLSGAQEMVTQIEALRGFSAHIQELSSLENSLTELYEMSTINNINTFCEELMERQRGNLHPNVSGVVAVPKLAVKTNTEQLERILTHLLRNAAEQTEEGRVILDFKKRGAHTHQFIVTDTGVGIPAEQQENLFKPFAAIHDLTQGDGLGLPICALIATKLNGSLTLDTSYTKGSRFVLELHT